MTGVSRRLLLPPVSTHHGVLARTPLVITLHLLPQEGRSQP